MLHWAKLASRYSQRTSVSLHAWTTSDRNWPPYTGKSPRDPQFWRCSVELAITKWPSNSLKHLCLHIFLLLTHQIWGHNDYLHPNIAHTHQQVPWWRHNHCYSPSVLTKLRLICVYKLTAHTGLFGSCFSLSRFPSAHGYGNRAGVTLQTEQDCLSVHMSSRFQRRDSGL